MYSYHCGKLALSFHTARMLKVEPQLLGLEIDQVNMWTDTCGLGGPHDFGVGPSPHGLGSLNLLGQLGHG